jgi:glycine/D-amino acid oxidase-like deaminating enzyme
MTSLREALVIGGGFYGTAVATHLAERHGMDGVILVERGDDLLQRASYANQARVHNGYHYPRSFTTAYRSRINMPRFVADYREAVGNDFTKVYAIGRQNSKVTSSQFMRFCREIGASFAPAPSAVRRLFEPRLIESVFVVEEYVFDASVLRRRAWRDLRRAGVETELGSRVAELSRDGDGIRVRGTRADGSSFEHAARHVFNCTYSGLNQIAGELPPTRTRLKHEITEIALLRPPEELAKLGITVMDGPFFSIMPFPARGLHSLSHVRYTPHRPWADARGIDPYAELERHEGSSRVDRMVRDASRYVPAIRDAVYEESLFEVKTVLLKSEGDDGRPILFESHTSLGSCHSVMGGKIDNVYDAFEILDQMVADGRLQAGRA